MLAERWGRTRRLLQHLLVDTAFQVLGLEHALNTLLRGGALRELDGGLLRLLLPLWSIVIRHSSCSSLLRFLGLQPIPAQACHACEAQLSILSSSALKLVSCSTWALCTTKGRLERQNYHALQHRCTIRHPKRSHHAPPSLVQCHYQLVYIAAHKAATLIHQEHSHVLESVQQHDTGERKEHATAGQIHILVADHPDLLLHLHLFLGAQILVQLIIVQVR